MNAMTAHPWDGRRVTTLRTMIGGGDRAAVLTKRQRPLGEMEGAA